MRVWQWATLPGRRRRAADGAPVTHEQLLERASASDEFTDPFTSRLRVTVNRLRRRLGGPPVIETVVGVGYVIR